MLVGSVVELTAGVVMIDEGAEEKDPFSLVMREGAKRQTLSDFRSHLSRGGIDCIGCGVF